MTQTAMCWGIACGDGWYDLIDELCSQIQNRVENVNRQRKYKADNKVEPSDPVDFETFSCEAVQVKEKFGSLCFYICNGDDYIDGLIDMAESMSSCICPACGKLKDRNCLKTGRYVTLCSSCESDRSESIVQSILDRRQLKIPFEENNESKN